VIARLLRCGRDDRGAFALELAILAPVLLALFVVIWEAGQVVHAQHQVQSAAEDLARVASAQNVSVPAAQQLPTDLASYSCDAPAGTANPVPSGDPDVPDVTAHKVTITCRVSLIGGITRTVTAEAISYDDPYRSTPVTNP